MIIYLLLEGFCSLAFFTISMLPTIETPLWLAETMPQILRVIYGFNIYLPVYESFTAIFLCIGFTVIVRLVSVVGGLFRLNI